MYHKEKKYSATLFDIVHGIMADPDLTREEKSRAVKQLSGMTRAEMGRIITSLYKKAYGSGPNQTTPLAKSIRDIISANRPREY